MGVLRIYEACSYIKSSLEYKLNLSFLSLFLGHPSRTARQILHRGDPDEKSRSAKISEERNAQRGGVVRRPLEVQVATENGPEQTERCAQQEAGEGLETRSGEGNLVDPWQE